jgi:hypothetical protein
MTRLESAIKDLGNTVESIMNKLREKGIKGKLSSSCDCPIANYLKACGFSDIIVGIGFACSDTESACVPIQVGWWIAVFDFGSYPEFVA